MAVRFVIGRAGCGKTRHCMQAIVAELTARPLDGPPIIFLTPRQATFSAERELACNTPLNGYFRARVLSFEQLGHEILAECGGAEIPPEVTARGRQMLLGHLLQQHRSELNYFQTAAQYRSLAGKLDTTFSEFERAGQDVGQFDAILKDLGEQGSSDRADKMHDLSLIYRAYAGYLGQDWLDQHLRLMHVLKQLEGSSIFADATLLCDGFFEFTDYERKMLVGLAKRCRDVQITLPIDPKSIVIEDANLFPPDDSLFYKAEMAYRRLFLAMREENVAIEAPLLLEAKECKFAGAALRELERSFEKFPAQVSEASEGVELLEAADRAGEVQAAARRILQMVAQGRRFRDIAVLVRNLPDYLEPISLYFREHRIPFFADYRRPSNHHPLLQFIRALLVISRGDWPHDSLMQLLKTDLTGLTTSQADQLENYVLQHCIRGRRWASDEPWNYEPAGEMESHRQALVQKVRPLVESARAAAPVREQVRSLFDALERFGIREHMAQWISAAEQANRIEEMAEHQQVWAELVKLFDEMVDLLGDQPVSMNEFQEILEAGLETFDLGLTPPMVDQVLVGQIDRTRTPQLKGVLVLGLNERSFPQTPQEDSVLSDREIHFFREQKLEIGQPSERRLLDENMLAYSAFTSASDLLYISRHRSDSSGRAVAPSRYWNFIRTLLPNSAMISVGQKHTGDAEAISTPRQLIRGLAEWVRRGEHSGDDSPWARLYQWLAESMNNQSDPHYRAWSALQYDNGAALSPAISRRLFPIPLQTTATALESFAACPFQHFVSVGLGLRARQCGVISAIDLGQAYHQVLQQIVQKLVKQNRSWIDLDDTQRQRLIAAAAKELGQKIRGEVFLSSARNRYLLAHIEQTLNRVVQTQKALAARSSFKPRYPRVGFGPSHQLPHLAVPIPSGGDVHITGSVDRIDLHNGGEYCSIVDYKLGSHKLSLQEAYYGLSLHLLICLLAIEEHSEALCGRKVKAAAAFYMTMLRGLGDVENPEAALEPDCDEFHLAAKPRGIIDEQVVRAFDNQLQNGESSLAVYAKIIKDGSFGSRDSSDVAGSKELTALLHHVRHWIGALADRITQGEVSVHPYMLADETPCPKCDYRAVCRFQPSEGYKILPPMKRSAVLETVVEEMDIDEGGK